MVSSSRDPIETRDPAATSAGTADEPISGAAAGGAGGAAAGTAPIDEQAAGGAAPGVAKPRGRGRGRSRDNMLPGRERRRLGVERVLVRLVATSGIVGIGVALGAILVSSKTHGWIVGLVVALVTVVLSAILWSSRQL